MPRYDIFISYARKDIDWVRKNLVTPIGQCRKIVDGRRPSIFFDVGEEGIDIGAGWRDALAEAMDASANVILIYSFPYFDSRVCHFEREMAQRLYEGNQINLCPILLDPAAERFIPMAVAHIHYYKSFEAHWFTKLCDVLRLRPAIPQEQTYLKFLDQPGDIIANHTLPPVRVALFGGAEGVSPAVEEDITISCDTGELQGTTTIKTVDGVATFVDLAIPQHLAAARLIASIQGLEPVVSQPFKVITPSPPPTPTTDASLAAIIKPPGEVVFFADGKALAVIRDGNCSLYDRMAQPLRSDPQEINLKSQVRLWRSSESLLALADWSGHCYLFTSDGRCRTWNLRRRADGFNIPGDLSFAGEEVVVGYWGGTVYRLSMNDGSSRVEFYNDSGVQALVATPDRVYVCGFDGMLKIYQQGQLVNSFMLEPGIRLLKQYPDLLVAVGEKELYQIDLVKRRVLSEKLPLPDLAHVWGEADLPVIINNRGKGIRIDSELAIRARFHTASGSLPVCADRAGQYCIFCSPDGLRTLLKGEQIVFTHPDGAFAVAPHGDLFALGDESGIRLLTTAELESMMEGGGAGAGTAL